VIIVKTYELTGSIELGEVATLKHEIGDHAVEDGALVGQRLGGGALLARAKRAEVLRRTRAATVLQSKGDPSLGLAVNGNVKVNDGHLKKGSKQLWKCTAAVVARVVSNFSLYAQLIITKDL
jgi:hypothetical protein